MIYFDKNKTAYAFEIENPVTVISDEIWQKYAGTNKWDIIDGNFVDITETKEYKQNLLSETKKVITEEINKAKELAFKSGIIFNGNHFDCDDRAQDRTGNRLLLLNALPVESLIWLDYEYKEVLLTAEEFQQLCSCIFERVQFIEFKTGQLLSAVENAQTKEELEAITVEFTEEGEQNDV